MSDPVAQAPVMLVIPTDAPPEHEQLEPKPSPAQAQTEAEPCDAPPGPLRVKKGRRKRVGKRAR